MEGQLSGSLGESQYLEAELTKMLEGVVPPEMSQVQEQCICRVPQRIHQVNPEAYTPQVVSIGPFHKSSGSGQENSILKPMEELKIKYLKAFLNRTELHVGDFVPKLKEWENRIRSCYAESINYNSNDFLKMILVDACFIIEHFLRCYKFQDWFDNDPLLLNQRLRDDIFEDLILLENQLPLFVLEDIYNFTDINLEFPSFITITFVYFETFNKQNIDPQKVCPKHFTDLLRTFMLPSTNSRTPVEGDTLEHVYSASQLSEAGLVFEVSPNKCLLDLEFDKVVLTIPRIDVEDRTESRFSNVLAFEQCYHLYSPYIAQYISVLDFLIKTEKDVNVLIDAKIIVNWIGDAKAVARMIKNLNSNIILRHDSAKYISLCNDLNEFYDNPRNKYKAIFIHEYFNTPWKMASTIAAVVLLLLTLIQTICSIISLFKGN